MQAFVFASALSLAFAGAAEAAPAQRVASLNLCTDELLLMLARPEQIVSVTHLSQQAAETRLWRQARRYRKNDGSLVSVAGLRPELILTMGGGVRDQARIAGRLGMRLLDIPYPQSLSDVESAIRTVSEALGNRPAGEALLKQIAILRRSATAANQDTIWLGGGGRSVAARGLAAEWMRLAGFRQRALRGDHVSLEELLVRPPAVLLRSDYRGGEYSAEQRWLSHPLAKGTRRSQTITSDGRPWTCMGPSMIGEVLRLRKAQSR
jgi:iron complex transport system substrate-binding protein